MNQFKSKKFDVLCKVSIAWEVKFREIYDLQNGAIVLELGTKDGKTLKEKLFIVEEK